jgi:hypothetical protein
MAGLEFTFGTSQAGLAADLLWITLNNGNQTGSGTVASLAKGTVVGWSDPSGFDELLVAAHNFSVDTVFNAIALDNLEVQLAPAGPAVPEPAGLTLAVIGMASMLAAWLPRIGARVA